MSSDERLARRLELRRQLQGGEGLAAFMERTQPHRPALAHMMPVIRRLERARLRPVRICVELPPRHGKTSTVAAAFPWWLSQFPADLCGYFTYSDKKARSESRKILALAARARIELDEDRQAGLEWRTLAGGGLLAGGAGGGLTGYGIGGLMVVDDPFKNRREAQSILVRDRVYDWFNDVAFTRDEGCSFVVMHTRWHEDDLIGRLEKDGWEVIRLPAIAEENDLLGREVGGALWPDVYPLVRLNRIRRQIGEFRWASLYQQRPVPRGAKLFGTEHYYDPDRIDFTDCVAVMGADTASSKKTTADSSSGVCLMIRNIRRPRDEWIGYVVKVYNEQVVVPQFARDLAALQAEFHGAMAYVENAGIGKGTYQVMKDVDPDARVEESPAKGDKFERAQGVSAAWNQGRVLVPLGPEDRFPWRKGFLRRLQACTGVNDAEDDDMDALAHAWNGAKPGPAKYRSHGPLNNRRI